MTRLSTLATLAFFVFVAVAFAAVPLPRGGTVNFASDDGTVELRAAFVPSTGGPQAGGIWYMMTASNDSVRPATRIILADQPANESLRFFPPRFRPAVLNVASSDAGVTVEHARSLGRHAFRITIPPATSATLALQVASIDARPAVTAWAEPALVSHNRQLAIFFAAVAGLIAAATAITIGLAVMTAHPAPRWASVTLILVLLTRLGDGGVFDAGWTTVVGGPYGLQAMIAGFALASGIKLADVIAPIEGLWPGKRWWLDRGILAVVGISLFAFLGVPGATVLTEALLVVGSACIAAYLVHNGRIGQQAARVASPSAAVFALVTTAAAVAALGGFQENPTAPAIIGGFAAAGGVLLALAIAAGEGIAILPAGRNPIVHPDFPQPTAPVAAAPVSTAALQAIGASHQGVFDLDLDRDEVRLSVEAATLIGMKKAQTLRHAAWIERIHPEDRAVYEAAISDYRGSPGIAFRIELRVKSESGRYPWFELRATMMGEGDAADRCLGLMADVTTRKEAEAAAIDRTTRDTLTGLGNRVALMEELEQLGARLNEITFAQLDIDRFKSIHASLGDEGGDAVLAAIAERLATRFKNIAEVFRVRGDAFAVLFPVLRDPAAIGAELVDVCRVPIVHDDRNIFAPASVGVVAGRDARDSIELLRNAELALNQAKRAGGCCARVYTRALDALAPGDPVLLETELRKALEHNQLDVYYQPIVRLADDSVAGFEALIRWNHPTKGVISPSDFVAHSEETGIIVELGRLALERAAYDLSQWQRHFPLDPPLFASVNLSRRQLNDSEFADYLGELLAKYGIAPATLKLELTEAAVANGDNPREALARIRATGAGLSIDDFGTGQSSLSQLKDMPFDTVKIDKSFLALHGGTHADADGAVILGSIVNLAHELRCDVVVEGVESESDVSRLKDLGCEFAQGFYYSQPLPRAEALRYIAKHYRVEAAVRPASGATGVG